MTKVACKVSTEVVFVEGNREVTWIFGKRPCLYKGDGGRSIVASLACACCEVLSEVTTFIWNK